MVCCAVHTCRNRSNSSNVSKDGITFHKFPNEPKEKIKWYEATGRPSSWIPTKYSHICSKHFTPDCFDISKKNRRRLFEHAVPSLYLRSNCGHCDEHQKDQNPCVKAEQGVESAELSCCPSVTTAAPKIIKKRLANFNDPTDTSSHSSADSLDEEDPLKVEVKVESLKSDIHIKEERCIATVQQQPAEPWQSIPKPRRRFVFSNSSDHYGRPSNVWKQGYINRLQKKNKKIKHLQYRLRKQKKEIENLKRLLGELANRQSEG